VVIKLLMESPSQSYGASPAIWDHTVKHPTQVTMPSTWKIW